MPGPVEALDSFKCEYFSSPNFLNPASACIALLVLLVGHVGAELATPVLFVTFASTPTATPRLENPRHEVLLHGERVLKARRETGVSSRSLVHVYKQFVTFTPRMIPVPCGAAVRKNVVHHLVVTDW